MDFNEAMAVAAKAEEDGDDVAADNMRAAIQEQDTNLKQAAMMNSEHEDWLRQIDVPYINACNDVEELHKISQTMQDEGFAGLMKCANERLLTFNKCAATPPPFAAPALRCFTGARSPRNPCVAITPPRPAPRGADPGAES